MDMCCEEVEDSRFFDALEALSTSDCDITENSYDYCNDLDYGVWIRSPQSTHERRDKFLAWMEECLDTTIEKNTVIRSEDRTSCFEDDSFMRPKSRSENSDVAQKGLDGDSCNNSIVALNPSSKIHSFAETFGPGETEIRNKRKTEGIKKRWLNKFRSFMHVNHGEVETENFTYDNPIRDKARRLKVLEINLLSKFCSNMTMKFSPDGQYLATAGEDGIVRLWRVAEDIRSCDIYISKTNSPCLYFTTNHRSELPPLKMDEWKVGKYGKASVNACVILPPKVFCILEKPLHELHGHGGDVLDISWSKNNLLLSASVDSTVRLWKVGCDHCLKVFRHNNYVTCVQFSPDDNYFISGSIDGKVRIWSVLDCQVVNWTDIREIITSVCYRPDGKGGAVGSITGNCRFYNVSDNHLEMDAQICLRSKKKSPGKRIIGLQFRPEDPSKVMVTCADSQVRILHGNRVISKYRGLLNSENQIFASITSDGKHIISTCKDCNEYVWNNTSGEYKDPSQRRRVKSCECFSTAVAIPWSGLKNWDPYFHLNKNSFREPYFPKASATWPEEKLPNSHRSTMNKSHYRFVRDDRIRSFHNYWLP